MSVFVSDDGGILEHAKSQIIYSLTELLSIIFWRRFCPHFSRVFGSELVRAGVDRKIANKAAIRHRSATFF